MEARSINPFALGSKRWLLMRRFVLALLSISTTLVCSVDVVHAQQNSGPRLQKLAVPAAQAKSVATKLSLQYREVPGVQISPDVRNGQLVVMAPEATQQSIDVHRQLSADPNQDTEMAVLLRQLGELYAKADRAEDAARATGEAVELYRKGVLAKPQADMLKSWLVGALNEWSAQLQSLGRNDEALVAAEEAVHHSRSLARTWMGPKDLRSSLHRLASILTALDRDDEAAAATQEADSLPLPSGR